jgi:RNA polymerase sigma factor (sigma-70 family)
VGGVLAFVTDMPEPPSVARELAQHSASLRTLARDLVGQDADDLLQDTAVRTLRTPPNAAGGLFGWLSTVMKNLAANRRRDHARRQRRERGVGERASAASPSAAEDAMHRDTLRAVTEALWSLPEPYQSSLVQRYFQDLSPAEIAARTATPVATIKSRLQRGLDLLRVALARRVGRDWRAALVPAFGLARPSPWLLPLLSVSSMTMLGKTTMVTAAGVLAAFGLWLCLPTATPAVVEVAVDGGTSAPAATTSGMASALPIDRSEPPAASAAASDLFVQPFAFELCCRVHDSNGRRIGGAQIALAPPACALALWPEATDGNGEVRVKWSAKVASMTLAVGLVHGEARTGLQQVAVTAGTLAQVTFVAGAAPLPAQVALDALGRQIVTMPECAKTNTDCASCHGTLPAPNVFEVHGRIAHGLHPDAIFGDRLALAPPVEEIVIDESGFGVLYTDSFLEGSEEAVVLSGRVFGADGRPAPGVAVELHRPEFAVVTPTIKDGSFRFPCPANDGPVLVRAGGGPEGFVATTIQVVDGQASPIDLFLELGSTLRGRVIAPDGRPLNGARVEYVAGPGQDCDLATVGPDGVFAFANLPPGPATLLVWGVRGETLPIAVETASSDGSELVIDLRSRPPIEGSLRAAVVLHDDAFAADSEVRLWQRETGRGSRLERREDGAFHAHGLAAGFYRLEVGSLTTGFRDHGQHWVDGLGATDLGNLPLPPPPGRVRFTAADRQRGAELDPPPPGASSDFELYARRADIDLRVDEITPRTQELALPAGRWLLLQKRGERVEAREFELVSGATVTLPDL